jgi:aryl-alcohol dehydrogenase-like predicted oxidoreductase
MATLPSARTKPAAASGVLDIGGDLSVNRLGFGALQLTGPGVWGEPADRGEAIRVLRRAVELGVTFIDTADAYGPYVSENLIREALHPYADDLVIGTKAGLVRTGPGLWSTVGRPQYLRQEAEMSLRRLSLERIDLFQLHRIDPEVPLADQVGELLALQHEGKVRHIGMSQVTVEELEEARAVAPIATVQNLYNLASRRAEEVLDHCEAAGIAFIPWAPVAEGRLARPRGPVQTIAREVGATPAQLALAWLLRRSPVMLPIPGTAKVAHLEENVRAARVELSAEQAARLERLVS